MLVSVILIAGFVALTPPKVRPVGLDDALAMANPPFIAGLGSNAMMGLGLVGTFYLQSANWPVFAAISAVVAIIMAIRAYTSPVLRDVRLIRA
jgi:hypothetical protein